MSRNLLILTPEKDPYTTTFIKAHFEYLKGNKMHLYGVFFPNKNPDGTSFSKNFWERMVLVGKRIGLRKNRKALEGGQFYKFLLSNKPDVVLAEFGPVGAEVTSICQKANIPLVVHFHGFDAYAYNILKRYNESYKQMFSYASAIVVVSRDMEKQLIDLGAPPNKVIYNCYGPSKDFFSLSPGFNEINFLAVGRFVDKKAPYLTLAAFKMLSEKFPGAKLFMAGDGPLLFACKNLTRGWNLKNRVEFIGALNHEEVKKRFDSSYCFLQHSIVADSGDSEGTPLGILEASASGIPIVATRHAGIKDVVIHGETGFLVDEGDIDSMAEYMAKLASDKDLAQSMGAKGRDRVNKYFTLTRHINVLDQILEKAINEKND